MQQKGRGALREAVRSGSPIGPAWALAIPVSWPWCYGQTCTQSTKNKNEAIRGKQRLKYLSVSVSVTLTFLIPLFGA
jgi:hypothetical protein